MLEALKDRFPTHDVVEFLGEGPILQQLELFATASLIIAPHGAGISNIIVSPLHTPVLEIGPPSCSMCYVHLTLKVSVWRRLHDHTMQFVVCIVLEDSCMPDWEGWVESSCYISCCCCFRVCSSWRVNQAKRSPSPICAVNTPPH